MRGVFGAWVVLGLAWLSGPVGCGLFEERLDPRDGQPLAAQDAQGRPHPWVPLAMEVP